MYQFSDLIKDDSGDSSIVDGFSVNYLTILQLMKLERLKYILQNQD